MDRRKRGKRGSTRSERNARSGLSEFTALTLWYNYAYNYNTRSRPNKQYKSKANRYMCAIKKGLGTEFGHFETLVETGSDRFIRA